MTIFEWMLVVLTLTGTILNVKKNPLCFVFWILSNLGWIYWDLKLGHIPQAVSFVILTGIAIWGLITWRREKKKSAT